MEPQYEELAERIKRDVTESVAKSVTDALTAAEQRLSKQARIYAEEIKFEARLAAEGYAESLNGIHRRLDEIEESVNRRLDDHDGAMSNHADRITKLERK